MERTRRSSGVADIAAAVALVVGISSPILLVLKGVQAVSIYAFLRRERHLCICTDAALQEE